MKMQKKLCGLAALLSLSAATSTLAYEESTHQLLTRVAIGASLLDGLYDVADVAGLKPRDGA
jgi:hypothetical protein